MNFKNIESPITITKELLLSHITETEVFYKYFGPFKLKKTYSSPFRKDDYPSFGFYINSNNEVISNDIVKKEKLDCIAFVAKLYEINYYQAIKLICRDFNLFKDKIDLRTLSILDNKKLVKKETFFKESETKKTKIQIVKKDFTKEDLEYWNRREITKKELIENNVYSISDLYINKYEIKNEEILKFAYYVKDEENNGYFKIYQPQAKIYKWISNIPLNLPFGYTELPYLSETLIVTKSQKERIIFKKFFTDVIATQNETIIAFEKCVPLLKKYKRIIICFDADNPGVTASKEITSKYNLEYFNTPNYLLKQGIKDVDEYVVRYGTNALKKRLKEKLIL